MDVIERFLAQATSHPDTVAIAEDNRSVSYGELFDLAKRVASAILMAGENAGVLIQLPQRVEAYASMLGTLMAGGHYCPINVGLPPLRKAQIASQYKPNVVISSLDEYQCVKESCAGAEFINIYELPVEGRWRSVVNHELAYVIFTSGSTGVPKGVMIRRAALAKFIEWSVDATRAGQGDRWAQFSNLGFDLSVMDTYTALGTGATLVPFEGKKDRMFPALAIEKFGVTIWHSVPSVIDLMFQAGQISKKNFRSLRLMSFCGEPLRAQHLETLFTVNPNITIFNTYGPTETTVFCTWIPLTADSYRSACEATVAIGQTIPGWRIGLVGGQHDNEGEIIISGDYIGAGYWRDPATTARSYRTIETDGRVCPAYYTGDWAERRGGHLFFSHRVDRQVKIHGFRLELDEVDHQIRSYGIPNCCSVIFKEKLYSFIESSTPIDITSLRSFLAQRLPHYGVPSEFIVKTEFPRNQNDKVDVKRLMESLENK